MKAFTAQIIYKIECEGQPTDQYEEEWRLIFANDDEQVLTEARKVANDQETTIIDRHGRTICWKLLAVKDIQPVEIENGALLFSYVKEIEPIASPVWMK